MARTVVGLFDTYSDAQAAIRDLEGMGFDRDRVSIVANDRSGTTGGDNRDTVREYGGAATGDAVDGAATGAGTGAVAGAGIGAAAGLLAGLGAIAIPGFGPVLAAGWLVSTITGAGIGAAAGAAAGGLIGALTEAGVPEEEAGYYQEGVRRGGTLVTVRCEDNEAQRVADTMNRHNVVDIDRRGEEYRTGGYTGRAGYSSGAAGAAGIASSTDNTNRGYAGVTTGSNTGFESAESDMNVGGNPDAARSNAGMGYTGAGPTDSSRDTGASGHSWTKDEEVGADADLSGGGAAVNHGYSGINTEAPTGGGRQDSGQTANQDLGSGSHYPTDAQDRDIRYEGGSAGVNAGGGQAGGYAGQTAAGSPASPASPGAAGSTYGGANTGVPVNPNAGVGGSGIIGESAASSAAGGAGTQGTYGNAGGPESSGGYAGSGARPYSSGGVNDMSRQPDYNESNSRDLAGVAHQDMPSRDDMRSEIPNTNVTSDSLTDEEDLGDTDPDLKRNRPGNTNVY